MFYKTAKSVTLYRISASKNVIIAQACSITFSSSMQLPMLHELLHTSWTLQLNALAFTFSLLV